MTKAMKGADAGAKNLTVAEYLTRKINSSDKSQIEIANQLGYANPNIITMFKQGKTKLPIPKVAQLASILEIDPVHLMRIVMSEYSPETWAVIERVLGASMVTNSEMEIVKTVRDAAGEHEVFPQTAEQKEELKALVEKWKPKGTIIRHH